MKQIPMVIQRTENRERACDIFSLLTERRIISLSGEIDDISAEIVMSQLLYLDSLETSPIMLYINSPGGSVISGMVIHDTMQTIKSPVYTVCVGMAASMASLLLAAGDRRFATPYSEVMIHQPLGGAKGQETDIRIHARHMEKTRNVLNELLSRYTGQPKAKIETDTERDNFMSAQEALTYGLIDEIIGFTRTKTSVTQGAPLPQTPPHP